MSEQAHEGCSPLEIHILAEEAGHRSCLRCGRPSCINRGTVDGYGIIAIHVRFPPLSSNHDYVELTL